MFEQAFRNIDDVLRKEACCTTELDYTEQTLLLGNSGIEVFIRREVLPHVSDAWYDLESMKTGYEISFTHYIYELQPLLSLEETRIDILALEKETAGLPGEIIGEGRA